eukprot:757255-Hanusia_phi.AAC.3
MERAASLERKVIDFGGIEGLIVFPRILVLRSDALNCYVRAGASVEDSWKLESVARCGLRRQTRKFQDVVLRSKICVKMQFHSSSSVLPMSGTGSGNHLLFPYHDAPCSWLEAILSAKHANTARTQAPPPEVSQRTTSRPMPPPGPSGRGEERLEVVATAEASGAAGSDSPDEETSSSEEGDMHDTAHGSAGEEGLPRECNPMAEDYYDVHKHSSHLSQQCC